MSATVIETTLSFLSTTEREAKLVVTSSTLTL